MQDFLSTVNPILLQHKSGFFLVAKVNTVIENYFVFSKECAIDVNSNLGENFNLVN
jgi:hypothetical protein